LSTTEERRYGNRTLAERRAERRSRLLAAGLEAFGSDGFGASSVEALCAAAGTSTRSFYEEFAGREELLIELHDQLNERAFDAVLAATGAIEVGAGDDPGAVHRLVLAGVQAYFDVMTADPRWARVALVETNGVSRAVDAARRVAIDRFAGFLEAQAGLLADLGLAERRDFRLAARAIVGALTELVSTWPERGHEPGYLSTLVDEASRFILATLTSTTARTDP
jgi:AcrR family transcriptional regulator